MKCLFAPSHLRSVFPGSADTPLCCISRTMSNMVARGKGNGYDHHRQRWWLFICDVFLDVNGSATNWKAAPLPIARSHYCLRRKWNIKAYASPTVVVIVTVIIMIVIIVIIDDDVADGDAGDDDEFLRRNRRRSIIAALSAQRVPDGLLPWWLSSSSSSSTSSSPPSSPSSLWLFAFHNQSYGDVLILFLSHWLNKFVSLKLKWNESWWQNV